MSAQLDPLSVTESSQRVLLNLPTSRRKVDECKPLLRGQQAGAGLLRPEEPGQEKGEVGAHVQRRHEGGARNRH